MMSVARDVLRSFALFFLAGFTSNVRAENGYEPFNYSVGAPLVYLTNATGQWWSTAGSGSSTASVVAASITLPELAPTNGASMQFGAVSGPSARYNLISNVTSGTLYFSFGLKVTSLGALSTNGGLSGGFNNSRGFQGGTPTVLATRLLFRANGSGGFNIGTAKNTDTNWVWSSESFAVNQIIFLVGSYTFNTNSSTDDVSLLWINPSTFDYGSNAPPSATLVATNGNDISSGQIASLVFMQRGLNNANQPGTIVVDEIRIGTNWASVTPRDSAFVDSTTLTGKLVMGYQGWHACQGDGSAMNKYVHWGHLDNARPSTNDVIVDAWPDLSEFDADELFPTDLVLSNGQPAKCYSAYKEKTVLRHFKWMRDYGVDGVVMQRFIKDIFLDPGFAELRNKNLQNVKLGAETHGRVFCLMYDFSNEDPSLAYSHVTTDWNNLHAAYQLTNSPRYLRHNGKSVVGLWGLGFNHIPITPSQAQQIIDFFKANGCTVLGGVSTYWRSLASSGDAQTNAAWIPVYRSMDIISPWAVGRFNNNNVNDWKNFNVLPDLAECNAYGMDYLPVIWPGYSSYNLNFATALNGFPRYGGRFYWKVMHAALSSKCTMLYNAMFDEIEEADAMYKMVPTMNETPALTNMFALNVDGEPIPNDWYLRLAQLATKTVRGELTLSSTMPISPTNGITVASPNGGETWTSGLPATITWSTTGIVGNVKIDLSTDGGDSWRALIHNTPNTGSANLIVPNYPSTNCQIRIQTLEGRPTDWSDNPFTIAGAASTTLDVVPLFAIEAGSRSYLTNFGNGNERGLAYNHLADELYLVSRTGGLTVNVLDGTTGEHMRTLKTNGISGGGFLLNAIGVTDDGVIYAANVTTSISAGNPLKVYRWANSDSNTVPTVAFSGTAGLPTGVRVGDTLSVRGSGTNTQILLGTRNDTRAILLRTTNGTNFTATLLTTGLSANQLGLGIAFGAGDTFWGESNSFPLVRLSFNAGTGAATLQNSFSTNDFPDATGPIGIEPSQNLLGAVAIVDGPDQLNLYDVSNLSNAPVLLSSWNFPSNNENQFSAGAVTIRGVRLYGLSANNGIVGLALVTPFRPMLNIAMQGQNVICAWTNYVPGFVLEATATLSTGWTAVTIPPTVINNQNFVTNTLTSGPNFYRLRR